MKKVSYKFELLYVKYAPFIVALYIIVQGFFHTPCLDYLLVPSMLTLIRMYNSLILYKFCTRQWLIVHYITINVPLIALHNYGNWLSCSIYHVLHLILLILFGIIYLILHIYAKKNFSECFATINQRFRSRYLQHYRSRNGRSNRCNQRNE